MSREVLCKECGAQLVGVEAVWFVMRGRIVVPLRCTACGTMRPCFADKLEKVGLGRLAVYKEEKEGQHETLRQQNGTDAEKQGTD